MNFLTTHVHSSLSSKACEAYTAAAENTLRYFPDIAECHSCCFKHTRPCVYTCLLSLGDAPVRPLSTPLTPPGRPYLGKVQSPDPQHRSVTSLVLHRESNYFRRSEGGEHFQAAVRNGYRSGIY